MKQNSFEILGLNGGRCGRRETPPPLIIVDPKIGDLCSIGNCPLLYCTADGDDAQ